MTKDKIRTLLQQSAYNLERKSDCPDDDTLASFIDGGMSERSHKHLIAHIADCGFCIERVGMLGRATDAEVKTAVPELVMARSRKLVSDSKEHTKQASWINKAPRWAAAAVVVLTIGLLLQPDVPNPMSPEPVIRETRNINPLSVGPSLLSPLEGMTVTPRGGLFSWTPMVDSLYYQVRIVSDDGDLIWEERVIDTQWRLPANLSLTPGAEYYVRIDAFLAESKALNSDYISFKVGQNQ